MTDRRSGPGAPPRPHIDRIIEEQVHDTYRQRGKPPEPTVCRQCGAVFHKGRWQWLPAPAGAHETLCAACHRQNDKYPAGYVHLSGAFFTEHRDEILHLVRNVEHKEKGEHPLRRVMEIAPEGDGVLITTTDIGLARDIGVAVNDAYKGGSLDYRYIEDSAMLRVYWQR